MRHDPFPPTPLTELRSVLQTMGLMLELHDHAGDTLTLERAVLRTWYERLHGIIALLEPPAGPPHP